MVNVAEVPKWCEEAVSKRYYTFNMCVIDLLRLKCVENFVVVHWVDLRAINNVRNLRKETNIL